MSPFKTFLFFFILVLLVSFYRNKDVLLAFVIKDVPVQTDTLTIEPDSLPFISEKEKMFADTLPLKTFLELPGTDSCLQSFFEGLKKTSDTLVRIIYYGDSQIEGDHLTYTLRSKLQSRFGGKGIGYMPMEMYFNTTEQLAIVTEDFEKQIVCYEQQKTLQKYGLYGRFFEPDSKLNEVRIINRRKEHLYDKVKLIYTGEATLTVEGSEETDDVLKSNQVDQKVIYRNGSPAVLKLQFSDCKNFNIYGLLLDSDKGIAVDDVSFRGNLNLMLNRFDGTVFQQMGKILQPALVVLHFGLNVVPDSRPNYVSYRHAVERDIRLLKKYLPGTSILVVGVSDMAHKVEGEFKTYANVGSILEEQRKAAQNEQVAFWNMRQAMGGEGAIIQWVEKGWARTDYAHLTIEGTRQIGELLNRDLMQAYDQYLKNHE